MRITCLTAGFTLTALFCSTAFGADPRLLNLVMPDANTLAGANVTNAEITPFGQYILARIASSTSGNQELQKFITNTGFDPRHDVSEILAASAVNPTKPAGLILALGNFPVSQITAAITAKAAELTVQTYGGATLITGAVKSNFAVAFLGDTIAVLGDTASVKAAIDRSAAANSIDPALAAQVQNLSTTEDAWAVTNSPVSSFLIPGTGSTGTVAPAGAAPSPFSGIGQMFSSIQSSSGGIKFGSTVVITGQAITNDAGSAKSLADVVQALASIASLAVGGQDQQAAALVGLLQGLKVTADGTTINLALSIPETQLETVLNGLQSQMNPAVRPAIRPAKARRLAAPATIAQAVK